MENFKSIKKFYIKGRGDVFLVKLNSDKNILEKIVKIDNEEYLVKGIESQGNLKEGKEVGLLVTKL